MRAGIRRVGAVVAHHPQPAVGDRHRPELIAQAGIDHRIGHHRRRIQVWLCERLAIHRQSGVGAALDGLPARGDHTLDQVVLIRRDEADERQPVLHGADRGIVGPNGLVTDIPVGRSLEDDHVSRFRRTEPIRHLVDHDPVADAALAAMQGGLHRLRRDEVRTRDEGQHHVVQNQGDSDQDRALAKGRLLLLHGPLSSLRSHVGRVWIGGHGVSVTMQWPSPRHPWDSAVSAFP